MKPRGFTLVELIVILILVGIMGAVALPHLVNNNDMANQVFGDRVISGLRLAQKSAVGHRRLVCVTVAATGLTLRMAASNPAPTTSPCANAMANAPDSEFTSSSTAVSLSGYAGSLYFQPNGDVTTDQAGTLYLSTTVRVTAAGAATRAILVEGSTGYVE